MDLDNFFEDLEAEFDAQVAAQQKLAFPPKIWPTGPVRVDLICRDSSAHSLIAATIGEDFVAGIDVKNSLAIGINFLEISSLNLIPVTTHQSIDLKISGKSFAEFSEIFAERKSLVCIKFQNSSRDSAAKIGWIRGAAISLICFFERQTGTTMFLPSSSISSIETIPVHN